MCTSLTIAFFILYEIGIVLCYRMVKKESEQMAIWIVLGSKVLKLILAAGILMLVRFLTEEPFVRFTLILLGILLVSVVFESVCFLRMQQVKKEK